MSIQLYIIRQSLTKQVHQSIKAIFLAIYVAIPKNDNEVVLIAAKYPKSHQRTPSKSEAPRNRPTAIREHKPVQKLLARIIGVLYISRHLPLLPTHFQKQHVDLVRHAIDVCTTARQHHRPTERTNDVA